MGVRGVEDREMHDEPITISEPQPPPAPRVDVLAKLPKVGCVTQRGTPATVSLRCDEWQLAAPADLVTALQQSPELAEFVKAEMGWRHALSLADCSACGEFREHGHECRGLESETADYWKLQAERCADDNCELSRQRAELQRQLNNMTSERDELRERVDKSYVMMTVDRGRLAEALGLPLNARVPEMRAAVEMLKGEQDALRRLITKACDGLRKLTESEATELSDLVKAAELEVNSEYEQRVAAESDRDKLRLERDELRRQLELDAVINERREQTRGAFGEMHREIDELRRSVRLAEGERDNLAAVYRTERDRATAAEQKLERVREVCWPIVKRVSLDLDIPPTAPDVFPVQVSAKILRAIAAAFGDTPAKPEPVDPDGEDCPKCGYWVYEGAYKCRNCDRPAKPAPDPVRNDDEFRHQVTEIATIVAPYRFDNEALAACVSRLCTLAERSGTDPVREAERQVIAAALRWHGARDNPTYATLVAACTELAGALDNLRRVKGE